MSFIAACNLARTATTGGRQLRTGLGLLARSQQQQQPHSQQNAYLCSSIERKETATANATAQLGSRTHAPNNFEKRMLVFTKKFKSVDEIPANINQDVMERCRNQVRIKVANYMMLATAIGCIVMILSGKKAQERGETVAQMNLDWHKEYNEKAQQEVVKS